MSNNVLVAVAWPYANGPRHIGHVAGFGVPSDIFARYQRMKGANVLMVSGTDEHGTPITVEADKRGQSPRQLVDEVSGVIRRDLLGLGMTYDMFTRTTTDNHRAVVQRMFEALRAEGRVVKKEELAAWSSDGSRALPDRYIYGTCPICSSDQARGDQCDNCGSQLDPQDLIDPKSLLDHRSVTFKPTEHYFLDLPQFAEKLSAWINAKPEWRSNVRNLSARFLDDLRPRAITRDLEWGVPVPGEGDDFNLKRFYVWFDAVIGYLSSSIEWAKMIGEPDAWRGWWQDEGARHAYFMGKDNIVFHSIIWPSILLGAGESAYGRPLHLPTDIYSSEFLTMEGRKFSSSRGVVIYVRDVLSRYSADSLRYALTAGGPETSDVDFTWHEFVRRNDEELGANWGNLVNRVFRLSESTGLNPRFAQELEEVDRALLADVEAAFDTVGGLIDDAKLKAALHEAMMVAQGVNAYLSQTAPWKLKKEDPDRAATVVTVALDAVANINKLLAPFLPFSAEKVHTAFGHATRMAPQPELVDPSGRGERLMIPPGSTATPWACTRLEVNDRIAAPGVLFPRLGSETADAELERLAERQAGETG